MAATVLCGIAIFFSSFGVVPGLAESESGMAIGEKSAFRLTYDVKAKLRAGVLLTVDSRLPARGTVVGARFTGTYQNLGTGTDAAEVLFTLFDHQGRSLGVSGADLGWSGEGVFGPSSTPTSSAVNGSLESNLGIFVAWATVGVGPAGSGNGHFEVTVEEPSPVALVSVFTSAPDGPRLIRASYSTAPGFEISYHYDESLGNWAEAPDLPCHQGRFNPTYFSMGVVNNTGFPLTSCQFALSWGSGVHDCTAELVAVLNDVESDPVPAIINTDDYLIDEATCGLATPLQPISLAGETQWLWARLIIGGVAYDRKVFYTKQ